MQMNTILNVTGAGLIGLGLTGAANIAGLVAREGLRATADPANGTALVLCYAVPLAFALAGFCFSYR